MKCVNCGTENQGDRKFCKECGTVLQVTCAACGTANDPGDKFCGNCGSALAVQPVEAPATAVTDAPSSEPLHR